MYKRYHPRSQRGIATLGITLMLLFIVTLVTLYTAKTSIKEQQISANQYRADQSLSTGNAALDWGIAYYTETNGAFCDKRLEAITGAGYTCPTKAVCTVEDVSTVPTKCTFTYTKSNPLIIDPSSDDDSDGPDDALSKGASEMYFAFVDGSGNELDNIPVTTKAGNTSIYDEEIKVVGIGHSDDDTGVRIVSLSVSTSNIFGDPGLGSSQFPLITHSTSASTGNLSIINRFDNRTIWSGDELDISGSTNTYILDDGLGWNCNDIANHVKCVDGDSRNDTQKASDKTQQGGVINADIIDGDPNLGNLLPDDFFMNFFGNTKAEAEQIARDMGHFITVDAKGEMTDKDGEIVNWYDLVDFTPLVWISVPDDAVLAPGGVQTSVTIGSESDPMVMIVDGDIRPGGAGSVPLLLVGVIYVTGEWDAGANPEVQGMIIVESGELGGNGNTTVIYDDDLFSGKLGPPPGTIASATPNSWKDWE